MKKRFVLFYLIIILNLIAKAQAPVAAFTQNQTEGCGFLVVKFTDQSSNNPTAWEWDFGDGSTHSFIQNPTHAYLSPGIYTVKLTATNASGSNTITKTNLIKVWANPSVSFSANVTSGCVPFDVNFSMTQTSPTPLSSFLWNFGDGSTSTLQNPSHSYSTTGSFSVSLSVTDTNGCSTTLSQPNYILAETAPTPNFIADSTEGCYNPFTVSFTNLTQGNNLSYLWNFGDATTSTAANPSHTYANSGVYSVSLTCTTPAGCTNTVVKNNYITVNTFQAAFQADVVQGCYPLSVNFSVLSPVSSAFWDFGDLSTSTTINPTHVFQNPGSYSVTLIATNAAGCKDTTVAFNYINVGQGLTVDFNATPTQACIVPFSVSFTSLVSGATSYQWNFGDGTTSTQPNPSHNYLTMGNFDVTLTVTDSGGCQSHITKNNFIRIFEPVARFDALGRFGCDSVHPTFLDSSISSSPIVHWYWDFGDGSPIVDAAPPIQHWFTDTGTYDVKLRIVNAEGCTDSIVRYDFVRVGIKPQISFAASDTIGCHPLTTFFTAQITPVTSFVFWRFGDGQSGAGDTITHQYADTGFFSVKVIATHYGCIDSLAKDNYIYVQAPKPLFTADSNYFCSVPHNVVFINQSHGGNQWLWDFGDGTTDTAFAPTHTYTVNGLYDVILYAKDTITGCRDSLVKTQFVGISDIEPGFVLDTHIVCRRQLFTLTDTSHHHFAIVDRIWDYGDNHTASVASVQHNYLYDTSGVFSIKLVLLDAVGCRDSITLSNAILVHPVPTSGFTASPLTGCAPLQVNFSQNQNPEPIIHSLWNFGDGSSDSLSNPSHTFQNIGNYTISLTLTNIHGCDSTFVQPNLIQVTYPQTNFTIQGFAPGQNAVVCHYNTVQFNNQSTGIGLNYTWSFGDGTFSGDINPSHNYNVSSTQIFTVTLHVLDTNGCDSSLSRTITISHPVADFTATSAVSDCPPFNAVFQNSSSSDVTQWNWNFGDPASGSSNYSIIDNPQHIYQTAGTYDVSLIVANSYGCSDTVQKASFIKVFGPSGTFSYSPVAGCSPVEVTFNASANSTATYHWLMGDGNLIESPDSSIQYVYTLGGNFIPVLLLEDSLTSPSDSATCIVTLIGNQPIRVIRAYPDFQLSTSFSCDGDTVHFTDLSTANGSISQWEWDFGDGTTSNDQNPSHFYSEPGNYDVILTVQVDSCIFADTSEAAISIFTPPPVYWTIDDSAGCQPLQVQFFLQNTSILQSLSGWTWNFANGDWADSVVNPKTVYEQSAAYPVSFEAHFSNGCTQTYYQNHNITVYPNPVADFSYQESPSYFINNEVLFNDQSQGNIVQWHWNFGDGSEAEEVNPLHNYAFASDYTVTLIVESEHECTDTIIKTITIKEKLNIPSAFTPNNDGKNDIFLRGVQMTILNRWGEILYEGNEGWDGKYKGKAVSPGTYFYIITLKTLNGEERKLNGSVTIIEKKK